MPVTSTSFTSTAHTFCILQISAGLPLDQHLLGTVIYSTSAKP